MKRLLFLLIIFLIGCKAEIPEYMTKQTCTANWNECSSPCLGTDSNLCIQVCQAQCECFGDYKCPNGYICKVGSFSEKGVCVRAQG